MEEAIRQTEKASRQTTAQAKKDYDEALELAHQAHRQGKDQAQKVYKEALEQAEKAYQEAKAKAVKSAETEIPPGPGEAQTNSEAAGRGTASPDAGSHH
jgi:predicted translin family RNA/ssDNA-binding protein